MKWPLALMESGANEHFIGSAIEAPLSPVLGHCHWAPISISGFDGGIMGERVSVHIWEKDRESRAPATVCSTVTTRRRRRTSSNFCLEHLETRRRTIQCHTKEQSRIHTHLQFELSFQMIKVSSSRGLVHSRYTPCVGIAHGNFVSGFWWWNPGQLVLLLWVERSQTCHHHHQQFDHFVNLVTRPELAVQLIVTLITVFSWIYRAEAAWTQLTKWQLCVWTIDWLVVLWSRTPSGRWSLSCNCIRNGTRLLARNQTLSNTSKSFDSVRESFNQILELCVCLVWLVYNQVLPFLPGASSCGVMMESRILAPVDVGSIVHHSFQVYKYPYHFQHWAASIRVFLIYSRWWGRRWWLVGSLGLTVRHPTNHLFAPNGLHIFRSRIECLFAYGIVTGC